MNAIRQASLPGFDLGDYIKESIDFLRQHEPPEGYFVGFSGGKDSITTLQLCKLAGVKHQAFYTYTTIDPPEVVRFIRAHYPQVQWLRPAKSFFAFVATNAPPCACSAGVATTSKSSRAGTCRLKYGCLAYELRRVWGAQNVEESMCELYGKGAGRRKRAGRYTPITTQFSIGQNGQFGSLSKRMNSNTPHYTIKGSSASAAYVAPIVSVKRLGLSRNGLCLCNDGQDNGRRLSMPSSAGGTKNVARDARIRLAKPQTLTGATTSTDLKNKEHQP